MTRFPALFLSHGAPTQVWEQDANTRWLGKLAKVLPRPRAIVVVTAHWETRLVKIGAAQSPETLHDFYGFPAALYEQRYPAPGSPQLAQLLATDLSAAGFDCELDAQRPLDHGVWVPLMLVYPEADIPVVPVSVQPHLGAEHHYRLGSALSAMLPEDVLLLASGGTVHNLRQLQFSPQAPHGSAQAFEAWVVDQIQAGRMRSLLNSEEQAPGFRWAHPTDEHWLPLLVAAGAGKGPGRSFNRYWQYGSLSMTCFGFDRGGAGAALLAALAD